MSSGDKCVYLHKDSDGIVRYVGSGTVKRANLNHANSCRGKKYVEFVEANGKLEVEIVAEGLSKTQAEDLERELYDRHKETIFNINRPNSAQAMTREMFEEHLCYDETTPSCLRWKIDGVGRGGHNIRSGFKAGCLNKSDGYYVVGLQGKLYYAHRIIAVLHGLEVEGKVIDHVDRNPANNKVENLRIVTQKENMQNKSTSSNNSSGVQGVRYDKQGYWTASWSENGKRKYKHFPIKNFSSSEDAFQAACEYRQQMVDLHYK